jgi:GNAT superfamily N-acetyltransferase
MTDIRRTTGSDLDAVYAICLQSADQGHDATHLYDDPKMIGHIYAAPYLTFGADTSLVAVDGDTVVGYLVGTTDTIAYEQQLERGWWPDLRKRYSDPDLSLQEQWTADQVRAHFFHHPVKTPSVLTDSYPAHLHMNLLAQVRGQGIGPRLLATWLEMNGSSGLAGVHVGTSAKNPGSFKFWSKCGFSPLNERFGLPSEKTVWLGLSL